MALKGRKFSANILAHHKKLYLLEMLLQQVKCKWNFLNYSIACKLSREPVDAYQTLVFLSTIREEAIYDGLNRQNKTWHRDKKIEEFLQVKCTNPTNLTNFTSGS